ncbi:MAG: class I SAM-dependent methyltransferase [Candidatus Thorarchaeota archaeon]
MICQVCGNSKGNNELQVSEMMFGFRDKFSYWECSNCGGLQIAEIPENLGRYYPPNYYSFEQKNPKKRNLIRYRLGIRRDRFALFGRGFLGRLLYMISPREQFRRISKLGIKLNYESKVLDVGCGSGAFLRRLKELGLKELIGIDPFLPGEAHDKGLKLLKKTIFDFDDQDNFDFIRFHHTLEHMPDQADVILKTSKLLSPTGSCMVSMPVKTKYIWKRYGIHWVSIDAPRHLFVHTIKSFKNLVEKTDLRIRQIEFDSSIFQFWASEQYKQDIPLFAENSYMKNPNKSIFSENEIFEFETLTQQLNADGQGDQATFHLKKTTN